MTELQRDHTAICFHFPGVYDPDQVSDYLDRTFMLPGSLHGEPLHHHIDLLLEEHSLGDCAVEITVFHHLPNGHWHHEVFLSGSGNCAA